MKGYILKSCTLFTVVIFLLSACGNLHDSLGMRQEDSRGGSIAQSSDGGMHTLKATTQSDAPLYYVMEKVGPGNVEKWRKYANHGNNLSNKLFVELSRAEVNHELAHLMPYKEVLRSASGPLGIFMECLSSHISPGAEVWVAYATCEDPTAGGGIQDMSNIEMSVAVLTHRDAPFQLHMGISRGIAFLEKGNPVHKGIAVGLHAFAAQAMRQSGQRNHYLITTPMKHMAEILKKQLPGGSWWEGHDNGTSPIRNVERDSNDRVCHFQLFDKQHKKIFGGNDDQKNDDSHAWFFNNTQEMPSGAWFCPYFIVDIDALCAHKL